MRVGVARCSAAVNNGHIQRDFLCGKNVQRHSDLFRFALDGRIFDRIIVSINEGIGRRIAQRAVNILTSNRYECMIDLGNDRFRPADGNDQGIKHHALVSKVPGRGVAGEGALDLNGLAGQLVHIEIHNIRRRADESYLVRVDAGGIRKIIRDRIAPIC